MPRSGIVKKHSIALDPLYKSDLVTRFINKVMRRGKKSLAQNIVHKAFEKVSKEAKKEPLEVFKEAIGNVAPRQEVRPRRVGGATYQVPMLVKSDRRETLAMRWIINAAKGKKGKSMVEALAAEILEASQGAGSAVKKKEEVHRMAEANRAFAHFRW